MFDGARADLSKSLNMNPAFQVTHSFTLGAQQASPMGGPAGPGGGTYNFAAIYASPKVRHHTVWAHTWNLAKALLAHI